MYRWLILEAKAEASSSDGEGKPGDDDGKFVTLISFI